MQVTHNQVLMEAIRGDIAAQPRMDAVVNAANAELRTGGGVAGAIHRAAGPGLEEECRQYAPVRPGEAVITGAHNLPNQYVIHCLGPVYGRDTPEKELLANCYRNALALADQNRLNAVAFPAISAGAFGYLLDEAAEVAVGTVWDTIPELNHTERICFVLFDDRSLAVFENTMKSS